MNPWYWCAFVSTLCLVPCGYLSVAKKDPFLRLIGIEAAGILETIIIVLLSTAAKKPLFIDVAIAMAILTFGGGIVFVRFLERWE